MKKDKPLTPTKLKQLSAYLDNQLSPKETQKLEALLSKNVELRAALKNIKQTRAVLRGAPKLQAPRNYTLTIEMLATKQGNSALFPAMRLVSAIASVMFVLLVVSDLTNFSMVNRFGAMKENTVALDTAEDMAMEMAAPMMAAENLAGESTEGATEQSSQEEIPTVPEPEAQATSQGFQIETADIDLSPEPVASEKISESPTSQGEKDQSQAANDMDIETNRSTDIPESETAESPISYIFWLELGTALLALFSAYIASKLKK